MQALGPPSHPPRPHPLCRPSQPVPPWIPARGLLQVGELNNETQHGVCCILHPGGLTAFEAYTGPGGKGEKTGGLTSLDSSAKLCSGGFWKAWSGLLQILIPFPDTKPLEAEP